MVLVRRRRAIDHCINFLFSIVITEIKAKTTEIRMKKRLKNVFQTSNFHFAPWGTHLTLAPKFLDYLIFLNDNFENTGVFSTVESIGDGFRG